MSKALLTVLVLLMACQARATHIIGGVLYYDHLGNDQYEVFLEVYRDCGPGNVNNTQYDALAPIGIFGGDGTVIQIQSVNFPGAINVPVSLDDPCLTAPPTVCVELAVYSFIATLPSRTDGYIITYQRCCRSPTIINIPGADDLGITCTVRIPGSGNEVNSAARFNEYPPIALCLGQPLSFDHSASDADGDSLVYALCTPFNGGSLADATPTPVPPPYLEVPWGPGFSMGYQMDSDPAIAIDPSTGLLTAVPTLAASYTVGVCVSEYRNGVLLNETRRDLRFEVVPCQTTVTAVIADQSVFCEGLSVDFVNQSPTGQYWFWDFGDGNTELDTSSIQSPSWTYDQQGTYTVTLYANPGFPCADTTESVFRMYTDPEPFFEVPVAACGDLSIELIAEGVFGPDASFFWQLDPSAIPQSATTPSVFAQFNTVATHPVSLTVTENGCTGTFTGDVISYAEPTAFFTVFPASPQNFGTAISFTDGSSGNGGTIVDYTWRVNGVVVGNAQDLDWNRPVPGDYVVELTVTTLEGCTASYAIPYTILEIPIDIPNVFSPNGDGSNEYFDIANIEQHQNELRIFNRWGMPIYEAVNYRNQWAALDVPDGTYYYELLLNNGKAFTGHLTLLR